jgi:hypothetical protein
MCKGKKQNGLLAIPCVFLAAGRGSKDVREIFVHCTKTA